MLVLETDGKFISELTAYQKPPNVADFEEIYHMHSQKTIDQFRALKSKELTEILNRLADLTTVDEDIFWNGQHYLSKELRKIPPRMVERRLF